jgi:hypothetical protein
MPSASAPAPNQVNFISPVNAAAPNPAVESCVRTNMITSGQCVSSMRNVSAFAGIAVEGIGRCER